MATGSSPLCEETDKKAAAHTCYHRGALAIDMQQRVAALQQRQLDDAEREASVDTDDDFGSASPPSKAAAAPPARKPIRAPAVPPPPAPNRPAVPKMQAPMSTAAAPKPAPPAPAPVKRAHEDDEPPAASSSSSSGPCSNYSIDLQATEFGMCKCTFCFRPVVALTLLNHNKKAATRRARTRGQCSAPRPLLRPTPSTCRLRT